MTWHRHSQESDDIELQVVEEEQTRLPTEDFDRIKLVTSRGDIHLRYYPAPRVEAAAIWLGGVGGDWDTPARGLYPRLCRELLPRGIASMRVRFRDPTDLAEARLDALAAVHKLTALGHQRLAVIGHSFGGAVAIQTALADDAVKTVITLATQSYGAAGVERLPPRPILFIHGRRDHVIPCAASEHLHLLARDPKHLVIFEEADHGLEAAADQVEALVRDWLTAELVPQGVEATF